jgi:hypothetical protein
MDCPARPRLALLISTLGAVCVFGLFPSFAHAYVDPGSGSMLLQLLLGGVAGLVVVLRLYWHRLLERFGIRRATLAGDAPPAAPPVEPRRDG